MRPLAAVPSSAPDTSRIMHLQSRAVRKSRSRSRWIAATWMIVNAKNGISSHELGRAIGLTQKSAWFVLQRIRLALMDDSPRKFSGEVEVDETFIGEKARNMHKRERARRISGTGGK